MITFIVTLEYKGSEILVMKRIEIIIKVMSIAFFIVLWHFLVVLKVIPLAIPSPVDVAKVYTSTFFVEHILGAILSSLEHVVVGFGLALIVAVPLGMFMGWFKPIEFTISPIVELFRPIPPIAWVAFALITFRNYLHVSAFIIFVGAFFPILTNTVHGFRTVSIEYIEVARSFGASKKDLLTKIALPHALPDILTGVKVGLGVGWMCVIAAEMFGAPGLGWIIIQMEYIHNLEAVMAFMFVVGALGFCMEQGLKFLEAKVLRWQRGLVRG